MQMTTKERCMVFLMSLRKNMTGLGRSSTKVAEIQFGQADHERVRKDPICDSFHVSFNLTDPTASAFLSVSPASGRAFEPSGCGFSPIWAAMPTSLQQESPLSARDGRRPFLRLV